MPVKKAKLDRKRRFMFWRKSIKQLDTQIPWAGCKGPTIGTLESKIKEATNLIDQHLDEIIIVEIVRVIKKSPPPVKVEGFKGV